MAQAFPLSFNGDGSISSGKSSHSSRHPGNPAFSCISLCTENSVFNRRIIKIARYINLWRFSFRNAYIFAAIFIAVTTLSSHDEISSGNTTKQTNKKRKAYSKNKGRKTTTVCVKSYIECTDMIPALLRE